MDRAWKFPTIFVEQIGAPEASKIPATSLKLRPWRPPNTATSMKLPRGGHDQGGQDPAAREGRKGALVTSGIFPEVMASFIALTWPSPPRVWLLNRENSPLMTAYVS
jgi:hypothetical protein